MEAYATVFHLVSNVEGELTEDRDVMDLMEAAFPGGSITGAPKYRAMEIIDELEHGKRGLYTGSIGYLTLDGACDFNIVIRTAVHKNGRYYLGVGGAESGTRYITAVESVDTSQLDLLATDVNTVDVIMSEVLPQKTKITLSTGAELSTKIAWYVVSETKIKGYIQSAYANVDQLMLEADYGYTIRFEYDDKLVRVSQIKLDGNAYTPGTPIDDELHALTFKVATLGEYKIGRASCRERV